MKSPLVVGVMLSAAALAAAQPLVEGNPAATVRVVIYEDLQCSDCAAFRKMLDEKLLPAYGARVAFEHRDFPLAKHAWARPAAIASRHFQASKPELAVAFRRFIMAGMRATTVDNVKDRIREFAAANGADPAKAVASLDNPEYAAAVEKDFQNGVARGVSKTPTAFVNGAPFVETFTFEEISKAIEEALQ